MDEYYNNDFSDESWKKSKYYKGKSKKLNTNPSGPYELELMFKGVNWHIIIENIDINDFKVTAKSDEKVNSCKVNSLKKYLQDEGFEMAAKKHNLFW
jgi:hypothetical protein